ncbi:MAG TPA: ZIP family metal transporter, partial [Thermotogota bacterium]|nr:ZIP family metal transporter [Thermotogota bacterium]
PLRREGFSRRKAFLYGQASGIVEPIAGVVGALAVSATRSLLPYALSFAAGAMIFVIGDEVIPESHLNGHQRLATYSLIIGFFIMSALDVALG